MNPIRYGKYDLPPKGVADTDSRPVSVATALASTAGLRRGPALLPAPAICISPGHGPLLLAAGAGRLAAIVPGHERGCAADHPGRAGASPLRNSMGGIGAGDAVTRGCAGRR